MPACATSALTAFGSVFSQEMNAAACFLCLDWVVTPVAEPPHAPLPLSPSQVGGGAIFHLPAVLAGLPAGTPGGHPALTQAICLPVLSALFQAGVYIGLLSMTPFWTRPPQYDATFLVAALSM